MRIFTVIIHIPQRCASSLPGDTKCECLAYVFGRWAVLEEVMACTEADLTIPAVLPYVSVDVALVTATTSSSDPCLQVEDHISVHHRENIAFFLTLIWLWSTFFVMFKQEHEGLNHTSSWGYELIIGLSVSSYSAACSSSEPYLALFSAKGWNTQLKYEQILKLKASYTCWLCKWLQNKAYDNDIHTKICNK